MVKLEMVKGEGRRRVKEEAVGEGGVDEKKGKGLGIAMGVKGKGKGSGGGGGRGKWKGKEGGAGEEAMRRR
ncbi:hypothetical protein Ancab_018725 [Ancistrocladus abbreviatus]